MRTAGEPDRSPLEPLAEVPRARVAGHQLDAASAAAVGISRERASSWSSLAYLAPDLQAQLLNIRPGTSLH